MPKECTVFLHAGSSEVKILNQFPRIVILRKGVLSGV